MSLTEICDLHSDHFDACRVCLAEPEFSRNLRFSSIVDKGEGNFNLVPQFEELLGIKVDLDDVKPKMICDHCYASLLAWEEMKKKAKEAEIVINYIIKKKLAAKKAEKSKASNSSATLKDKNQKKNDVNLNASTSASTSRASTSRDSTSQASNNQASTSRAGTSQAGTSQASTSRAGTSQAGTSQASTSRASTSRASTSRAGTSQASTSRAGTSQASTSQAGTSRASTSRGNYNHGHSNCSVITTLSRVARVVEECEDNYIHMKTSFNTVESENYSGYEIEDYELDIDNTKSEDDESAGYSLFPEARDLPQTSGCINNQNGNKNKKLYYCNICQKDNVLDHNCFEYNKNFSTCLVPNCNILSRSIDDFMPHYQLHIGMSSSAVMCKRCYQEIEQSDFNINGCHVQCRKVNPFKCYTCNIIFNNMEEFAFHKLKKHNGRLMNSDFNYLCIYCEVNSPDLTNVVNHIKSCLENQSKNVPHIIRMKMPAINKTKLIPITEKTQKKNEPIQRKNINKKKYLLASKMVLFTCLKPTCNLVYQSFSVFKHHYRHHSGMMEGTFVCWQCCVSFANLNCLRAHQVRGNCRTPGMFKCGLCPEKFDDIQLLSAHKYTLHDGILIANKKYKPIKCPFCKQDSNIDSYKSHLSACQKKSTKKTNSTKNNMKGAYKCGTCDKSFDLGVSLSNHSRIHKSPASRKSQKKN